MQEKLLIYLHAHDLTQVGWATITEQGKVSQSAYQDSLQGLSQFAQGKQVVVILPGEDILFLSVVLPKLSYSKLLRVLPFALEEQLTTEVENLHFALGEKTAENEWLVAIVAKEKMQQWLALLNEEQIEPTLFISSLHTLPVKENTVTAYLHNEMAYVRINKHQAFACDRSNLRAALSNLTASNLEVCNYTQTLCSHELPKDWQITESQLPQEAMLESMSQGLSYASLNLLQGNYAVKSSGIEHNRLRKLLVFSSVAFISILFLYPLISYFILSQQVRQVENEINQIYKYHFPQAKRVVAPKMRLKEKRQKLLSSAGENRFLVALSKIGKNLHAVSGIKLTRFDFQNNQLIIYIVASNTQDFSAFTDNLTKQGLSFKQQNATLTGERIDATLLIEIA